MSRPLISTKLHVPRQRRGLVPRPRLGELLARGSESRLILLSAPAGFGKTTAMAQWLGRDPGDDRCVAWLSLDREDNDPAAFWTGVVAALDAAVPAVDTASMNAITASPRPDGPALTTLLNELATQPSEVWLVLDDYHYVSSREVHDTVAFFLEHLPPRVHVVIGTRADPDLPLSRFRGQGELVEIRAAQLRFTPAETEAYLNTATGLGLAPEQVAVLEQRTEGWIAALQLAALSLRGRGDVDAFITRFAGNNRYIVDYLIEEVLRHQPDPIRDFLLDTSVLDRLTGPLCDALTGRDDGSRMLVDLERANLFILPLDDSRRWYRYHHLFADVLRARLLSDRPGQVPLLHLRASRWHEDHCLVPEAVRHAFAAGDLDRAAHLMEAASTDIRRNRQESMLLGWLEELPADVIRRSPVLSVFQGFMLMASGELDAVERHLGDAEVALAAAPAGAASPWADIEEFRTLPATIAIYRASLAQARGDVAGTTAHARHALELAGPGDHLARGAGAGFLGFSAWSRGDVSKALQMFTQSVASLHAAGNRVDELSSTVVLADLWLAAGRPGMARQLMAGALAVAESQGGPVVRATAELHVGLGEIACEAGDLTGAARHLEAAAALLEDAPMTESRYRFFVALGLLAEARGDAEQGLRHLDRAEPLFRRGFFPEVRPIAAMKARIWIRQGQLQRASDWVRERGIDVTDDASYLDEYDHLTLVRLLISRQREPRQDNAQQSTRPGTVAVGHVGALLERLLAAAEATARAGSLLEIRMLQALEHEARGSRAQALAALDRAFTETPEPHEHVRLFLNEGAPMMVLLRAGAHHGIAGGHAEHLLRLGASVHAQAPGPAQRQVPRSSAESLSERERQVLRLLGSELSGPQIAGELFISYNTLRTHTKHIFAKLGVTDRRAALRRARESGLL